VFLIAELPPLYSDVADTLKHTLLGASVTGTDNKQPLLGTRDGGTAAAGSNPASKVTSARTVGGVMLALVLVCGLASLIPPAEAELPPLVDRVKVGAYVHLQGQPYRDPVARQDLETLESEIGKLDLVHYFFTWGRAFDEALTSNVDGRDLMLSMKPEGDLVQRIAGGEQDGYIDRFAEQARGYGKPVYLRFGHEMNGEWMTYSAAHPDGPSADQFVAAWRHLVDRFRAQGAANVRFVWSPNEKDFPDRAGNRMEDYWPGEPYVDVAGFDGYNWTDREPVRGDGSNRSFEEVVAAPYHRIAQLTSKEIWLCEFGTVDPGKGRWFRDMFSSRKFPRLTGVVYFSEDDQRDVQRDWRIDSSADALAGWREGMAARRASSVAITPPPRDDPVVRLPKVSKRSPTSPKVVRGAQVLLGLRGFPVRKTGTYDRSTKQAVLGFQRKQRIPRTGVIDQNTWHRLLHG
jgi:mannan endo-1,4-beta-mannosidase